MKIKAKKDGETVELEFDEIVEADGIYTEEQVENNYVSKDYFESEVSRRISSAKSNAKEELASDDEFIRKQIRKRGGEFDEDGNLKSPQDVDIDKLTEDIKNEIYSEQVEPLKQENQSLKTSQLSNEVLKHGQKAGLTNQPLKPIKNGKSAIELMAEDSFAYHPDKETWAQVDEEGNFLGGANGLRSIDDWLKDLKSSDDYQDWFEDQVQNGSNYQGNKRRNKSDDEFEQKKAKVRSIRGKE